MREKIMFFVCGAIIATLAFIIGQVSNPQAQETKTVTTFEEVIIKGKLTVGDGVNKILLEPKSDKCAIIVNSGGKAVAIYAQPDAAAVVISTNITDTIKLDGIHLMTEERNGRTQSVIHVKDDTGRKMITPQR